MIFGNLARPEEYRELVKDPCWRYVFEWLDAYGGLYVEDQEVSLRQFGIRAIIRTNKLQTREERAAQVGYEVHRDYFDLHLCTRGGQQIDVCESRLLTPRGTGTYDAESDTTLYNAPLEPEHTVFAEQGVYAIFFPTTDAHMPGIADRKHKSVRTIVLKIPAAQIKSLPVAS